MNGYKYPNHAEAVKEFTEGRTGKKCPETPIPFDRAAGERIIGFKLSEVVEFARTLPGINSWQEAAELVASKATCDINTVEPKFVNNPEDPAFDEVVIVAEQGDAFTDDWYYTLDSCSGQGINLDRFFDEVHDANMRKKHADGTFHLKEVDGHTKVAKPEGWTGPDVEKVARDAFGNGSW